MSIKAAPSPAPSKHQIRDRTALALNQDWQATLRLASLSTTELLHKLELEDHLDDCDIEPDFRCLVTQNFIDKMIPGDIGDPLLRQVLPRRIETDETYQRGGLTDPVGDSSAMTTPGLLHKYHGRALMISTAACAVHCRYCFRRNYPYQTSSLTDERLRQAAAYIDQDPDIEEVILSGGDPLVLSNDRLTKLITTLEALPRLSTLRIHSRLPVVLPQRIDQGLIDLLSGSRLQVVLVIHCNHAQELGPEERYRLEWLADNGITLLNQSVLLKGINDDCEALSTLSKRLLACRTLPYYLHLLDPTQGAMHFAVDTSRALDIHRQLQSSLPGYLVPRLVQEIAGMPAKTAISGF